MTDERAILSFENPDPKYEALGRSKKSKESDQKAGETHAL